jgi:glyoxylase-like metal-dependent hydrolase (beta-lactamase superfamily II)
MAQPNPVSVHLFASGYCEAHANVVNPQESFRKTSFHAVWALFDLPDVGFVLFDTGYASYFHTATDPFPQRLYRWVTPVHVRESETAATILHARGVSPDDIRYVVLSHFHADHIGGLRDFPKAQFICSRSALEQVRALSGFGAVSKGILHALLPEDAFARMVAIEDIADRTWVNAYGMTEFRLFGTDALSMVLLPGHARGMLGFIHRQPDRTLFYGTDASWSYDTYAKRILPLKIVKLFIDSWDEHVATLDSIRDFEREEPNCTVLFTHCERTLSHLAQDV